MSSNHAAASATVSPTAAMPMASRNNNNATTTTTTNDNASGNNQRKRVRADPDPNGPSAPSASVAAVSRSLGTLPPTIKSFATECATSFHKLKNTESELTNKVERLKDTTYIPKSARVQFKLTASKNVQESSDFTTLAAETDSLVQEFQMNLRKAILAVAELELKSVRIELQRKFFSGASDIATLLLLNAATTPIDPPDPRNFLLSTIWIHPTVLEHTGLNEHNVYAMHKRITGHPDGALTPGTLPHVDTTSFQALQSDLFRALHATFAQPWATTLANRIAKTQKHAMENFLHSKNTTAATAAAAMELEGEPSVDPQTIRKIVADEVATKTKSLQATIQRLTQQQNRSSSKNEHRGAPASSSPAGASQKKKSTPKPPGSKPSTTPASSAKPKRQVTKKPDAPPADKPNALPAGANKNNSRPSRTTKRTGNSASNKKQQASKRN